jgi:hypothetical protein
MTKKSANQEGQAKAKAKADAAQAEQQSSWRNYKAKELARNPSMSVESLHSRFKAMSATQKVGLLLDLTILSLFLLFLAHLLHACIASQLCAAL